MYEDFGIYRSMRRGSESRATEKKVDDRVIDLINRWRKSEGNRRWILPVVFVLSAIPLFSM